jgi:hypothetical protein
VVAAHHCFVEKQSAVAAEQLGKPNAQRPMKTIDPAELIVAETEIVFVTVTNEYVAHALAQAKTTGAQLR